jgi:hypothetical protein
MADERLTALDTIRELKARNPFIPFTIVLASGDRYSIENADALAIGSAQLHYYLPRSDRAVHMALNQITVVEESEHKASV